TAFRTCAVCHSKRTVVRHLISRRRRQRRSSFPERAVGGACITPALFVDFLTKRAESGWSCSVVFSQERSLEAVWPVATGFHLVKRVALARSDKVFQSVWLLARL